MTTKGIKAVLAKQFNAWAESIKDANVKALALDNSIITGGCIVSMLLGEKIKDFDVYFANKETAKAVAQYYVDRFNEARRSIPENKAFVLDGADVAGMTHDELIAKYWHSVMIENTAPERIKIIVRSSGVAAENPDILSEPAEDVYELLEKADALPEEALEQSGDKKEKFRPVFLSSNAITLSDRMQLVIRFYGAPQQIHDTYDFVHCTNYWRSDTKELVLNPKALESIITKTLYYMGSKYPLCSIIRLRKFLKRGWSINAGQILKMAFNLNEFNLNDMAVLEDQLVGVDSAYFQILIDALHAQQEKDPDFTFDYGYVATIVDRIFG